MCFINPKSDIVRRWRLAMHWFLIILDFEIDFQHYVSQVNTSSVSIRFRLRSYFRSHHAHAPDTMIQIRWKLQNPREPYIASFKSKSNLHIYQLCKPSTPCSDLINMVERCARIRWLKQLSNCNVLRAVAPKFYISSIYSAAAVTFSWWEHFSTLTSRFSNSIQCARWELFISSHSFFFCCFHHQQNCFQP